jgi:hypothetical protein
MPQEAIRGGRRLTRATRSEGSYVYDTSLRVSTGHEASELLRHSGDLEVMYVRAEPHWRSKSLRSEGWVERS